MKVGLISNTGIAKERLILMLKKRGVNIEYIPPPYDDEKINGFDIIHLFPGYHLVKTSVLARLKKKVIINHWIGTDVMSATLFHKRRLISLLTNKLFDIQLAVSVSLVKELRRIGINAYVFPNVPDIANDTPLDYPLNKKGVLVYLPEDRFDFHRGNTIMEIASKFPYVDFHIVANNGAGKIKSKNIFFYGWLDDNEMENIWSKTNVLLRIPKHDGLSLMILEALARAKYVIWDYPFDFCYYVRNINEICEALENALTRLTPNNGARLFVLKKYNPGNVSKKYEKLYKFLLKKRRGYV